MSKHKVEPFAKPEANDSTGFLLWQVTAVWQRQINAVLRSHGLTQVQFALLASLLWLTNREKHITQVMLAKHSKLDIMMTSQVLRTLEKKGLIERSAHPTDTRAKILSLTKSGKALAWQAIPDAEKTDDVFFGALAKQQLQFNKLLLNLLNSK